MNQEQRIPVRELLFLIFGELITSVLIIAAFIILKKLDYTVVTGAALGSLVIVLNFVFICIAVNRAFDKAIADVDVDRLRAAANARDAAYESGDDDRGEEKSDELAKLVEPNEKRLSNAIRLSHIARTLTMIAALVLALITKHFNVIATVVPLFMQRPLLTISALTKKKEG